MKYPDFLDAIELCLKEGKSCKIARSDIKAAFRNLGILPLFWKYLIMKAECPLDGKTYYFVDKCLPFGASISCSQFQWVSNALAHVVSSRTLKPLVNYLDDYLTMALIKLVSNNQIREFLRVCEIIGFPVALEKTFWATTLLTFLGLLIDTVYQTVLIPKKKIERAVNLISEILTKNSRKVMVRQLQKLCGFLNFLGRAIVPGRAFTRRLYPCNNSKYTNLLPHHHLRITAEIKLDLQIWLRFLETPQAFCRPFMDFRKFVSADKVMMTSDASLNPKLGIGAICMRSWMYQQWDLKFMLQHKPSIKFAELYAVLAGLITWVHRFRNRRIILFCDNESVCKMINKNTSSCKQCMSLTRILVLYSLQENVRIFAKHLSSRDNQPFFKLTVTIEDKAIC